jgi:hypothetical protein
VPKKQSGASLAESQEKEKPCFFMLDEVSHCQEERIYDFQLEGQLTFSMSKVIGFVAC